MANGPAEIIFLADYYLTEGLTEQAEEFYLRALESLMHQETGVRPALHAMVKLVELYEKKSDNDDKAGKILERYSTLVMRAARETGGDSANVIEFDRH